MSRLSKIVFIVWLSACMGLFVWGGYRLPAHCHQNVYGQTICAEFPFGADVREEEDNPTAEQDLVFLGMLAFGLPTIVLAIASGVYFLVGAVRRRLYSK